MKRGKGSIYTAIDVGTTKICVIIARHLDDGQCEILGVGKAPSEGLSRGVVVDTGHAIQSIKHALHEAEVMAQHRVESAYVGVSGSHIQAHNSQGMVAIKNGLVRSHTVQQVLDAARTIPVPEDQQILHVMPQYYVIDGTQTVRDPLGMHGVRLEAHVHIITGGISSVKNLIRCCEIAGVKVQDIVLEPIASAEAILSQDERELGVAMLDIGGGTADFALYHHGAIKHTRIFMIAGTLFTHDLALCLRTTKCQAEQLKCTYGLLHDASQAPTALIESIDGQEMHVIETRAVNIVLEARANELFDQVAHEMDQFSKTLHCPSGLVITGGGALLKGLVELAQARLRVPVRIGTPRTGSPFKEALDNPVYATACGLLHYAFKQNSTGAMEILNGPLLARVFWRMKSWLGEVF